jgi:twitching motility two-component system response regulator PilG
LNDDVVELRSTIWSANENDDQIQTEFSDTGYHVSGEDPYSASIPVPADLASSWDVQESSSACPFCAATIDPQAFECRSCRAMLTLSDMESLLANSNADHELIKQAVTQMEAEWNFRDFSEDELTALGIGHLNLRNYEAGHKYLQEASSLNPNNVILSSQVNSIAIRMDEMSRASELTDSTPRGKTILVVDDSATVRKLISAKLEKSGHNVICAEDGVEALACIAEKVPDLVLLDITMPRMDGYEVCKNIRSNPTAHGVPVVMISGKDGFFDKVRGRMAGTTGYVTKPFGPETLMKALETYLVPDEPGLS